MLTKGTKVTWKSQASGSTVQKTGEVMAFIPVNTSIQKVIDENNLPRHRVMGQNSSLIDRYLVRVLTPGGKSAHYYTPRADQKFHPMKL